MPADPLEAALASLLEASPALDDAAVAQCCLANPAIADAVCAHVGFLRRTRVGPSPSPSVPAADRIGPFRLVRRIGGGGMGIVYLAVEEPLAREVAVKLIRPEHLPFADAKQRFRREVEVVAGLHHPGIVPIFSCGEDGGVPYYAMELVAGRSLATVLAELREHGGAATTAERLGQSGARDWIGACFRVALQVALALAHAHGRGVVHRDIKPSNVMLDAEGRARVIDFGLARVVSADSMTRTGVQPGSLAYMSPEQVRGEAVDERTDVWSLGVTLYELLRLRPPFCGDTEEQLRRSILESTPAQLRSGGSRIPWDAATVVATAMAPERARRYASMTAFAADLQAFVERRPITTRPPGPVLRLRRWVQRRPALSTGLLLGFLLMAGLPSALYLTELNALARVRREADAYQRVSEFMVDLFAEADPDQARGETIPARIVLDRGVRRIHTELAGQPHVKAKLLQAMGRVYRDLGLYEEAEPLLRGAVDLRIEIGEGGDELADAKYVLGGLLQARGDYSAAVPLLREVLELSSAAHPGDHARKARAMLILAETLALAGEDQEPRRLFEDALAMLRRVHGGDHLDVTDALNDQAGFLNDRDHPEKATPLFREALAITERLFEGNHPAKVTRLGNLAVNLAQLGEADEAERRFAQALRVAEAVFDPDHPQLAEVRERFGAFLLNQGRPAEARALLEGALLVYRRIHVRPHASVARALNLQGMLLARDGNLRGAREALLQSVAIYDHVHGNGHHDLAIVLGNLADAQLVSGQPDLAEQNARRALDMHRRLGHRHQGSVSHALRILATILAERGKCDEALQIAAEAAEIARTWHRDDRGLARALNSQAHVLLLCWRGAEAEPVAREALAKWARLEPEPGAGTAFARFALGWALHQRGDLPGAAELQEQALAAYRSALPAGHPATTLPLNELGVVLAKLEQTARAEELLAEALDILRQAGVAPRDLGMVLALMNLAAVRVRLGEMDRAEPLALECLAALRQVGNPADIKNGICVQLVVRLLQRPGRTANAAELEALRQAADELLPEGHAARAQVDELLRASGGGTASRPREVGR